MTGAYALRGVGFSYGGPEVLAIDHLDLPAGRVTALVGPNGSGKSTLLHLLGFAAAPTRGELAFFGTPALPSQFAALRRRAGLLLQKPYLFRGSVAHNAEWGLRARGVPRAERRRRGAEALARLGLAGAAGRSAHALSGGEAQRLALARLLALEPEVLLLDEPTNHLDAESRARVEAALGAWVADGSRTVVLATHDLGQAYRLGASVWQVDGGAVRPGEPDNVFRGAADPVDPGVFRAGRLSLHLHPPAPTATWVRVSPRDVVLAPELHPTSARNALRGVVTRAEVAGPGEVRVTLDCGEPLVAVVTRESWHTLGLAIGGPAVAEFKAGAVRVC